MSVTEELIQGVFKTIPPRLRGPGGAVAVVKDGHLRGQTVWGYADLEQRIPMTADIPMPICSISKQMTCAVLLDLERNPTPAMAKDDIRGQFSAELGRLLHPEMTQNSGLTINHLCDNRSGIRDYWALTTLWGAKPEGRFDLDKDGVQARDRLRSFHFEPGTEYSYSNTNFHILARLIEKVSGESFESLLGERVFGPAGMKTALLGADTSKLPPPCVGYEGDERRGYTPAINRIEWDGDAGIVASLSDMVAYEGYLHRRLTDPTSWYRTAIEPAQYSDGTPAIYHYGLSHVDVEGVATIGHGGALRGFRSRRLQVPKERLSVVVMLNHESEAGTIAEHVLRGLLNLQRPQFPVVVPSPTWFGAFLDGNTQLAITVAPGVKGKVSITYAGYPESITLTEPMRGSSRDMTATMDGNTLRLERLKDHRTINASRIAPSVSPVDNTLYQGDFYCAEIDSTFHCSDQGGVMFGAFDGFLGQGPAQLMRYLGDHIWALSCPRGMDAPAPGDWTVVFRFEGVSVVGVTVGCWLARRLEFVKGS
ncbi:hypothetical protein ACHAPT_010552 [Fusarium lateritium]